MTAPSERSIITLRALQGAALRELNIRSMIEATAHSLAERNDVDMHRLIDGDDSITVELGCDRLAALGFAAELRRLTTSWYTRKFGAGTLWGEPHESQGADWSTEP